MNILKIFILLTVISAISMGCSSVSVKDIKDMDPFLRGKTSGYDSIKIQGTGVIYSNLDEDIACPLS
ncbi:MAG TPA: hypothetical protein PLR38_01245 [Syntrophorhabdaceae bacterium]|nr:hypothetical protein [Syntrophorhabdaceae bacterium]HOL05273.1 hypothetical protein [Syntrophorhabdaceae bacterium]HPP41806.1 hypothetical protein [Syntrophorhabdaceae bacterium]